MKIVKTNFYRASLNLKEIMHKYSGNSQILKLYNTLVFANVFYFRLRLTL